MIDKSTVFKWLDSLFKEGIPSDVKALYLNLVESVGDIDIELFGIGDFDPNDEDWACDDNYQGSSLELLDVMGNPDDWEKVLQEVSKLVSDYIALNKDKVASICRIGIGFGDSEIELVKNEI
jgi:hypothetical protein